MGNITLGEIAAGIGIIITIGGFIIGILRWYISKIENRFVKIEDRLDELEEDSNDSKEERLVLLNGVLCCLKGLQEKGCNGPVTQGIKDIEDYLIKKVHDK